MKTSGNTVLITGGASGIGFELAKQLVALENTVLVTGRDETKLARAAKELPGLRTFRSDVGDAEAIRALHDQIVGQFPELNVLVNNAGIMRKVDLRSGDTDLAAITSEIQVNLMGPIRMVQQFLPHLRSRQNAAILNVSSGLAFVPLAASPVYCAAKAGLHSYTQSLRVQLESSTVKVFELLAPVTDTPMLDTFTSRDLEGTEVMKTDSMVRVVVDALTKDRYEIRPGISNRLKLMSRLAPAFILGQLNKSVEAALAKAV